MLISFIFRKYIKTSLYIYSRNYIYFIPVRENNSFFIEITSRFFLHLFIFIFTLVDYLKKEWEKLRDNYRKCLQRRDKLTRSGAGSKKLPRCNFFSELSFLKDVTTNRKTCSNINFEQNLENAVDNGKDHQVEVASQSQPAKQSLKRRQDLQIGIDTLIYKALSDSSESKKENVPSWKLESHSDDPETLFCLSLVDTLKQLPPRKKHLAKMKINELFYNLTEQEESEP